MRLANSAKEADARRQSARETTDPGRSARCRGYFARILGNQVARLALLLVMLGAARARPKSVGELVIIANSAVRAEVISAEDLRSVYLGTKTALEDGTRLKPVLEKPGPAHTVFLKEYMGKSDIALQTYYRSLLFSGKWSMPVTLRSDSEMVAYVAKTPDAIGYAQLNSVIQGVKILRIK